MAMDLAKQLLTFELPLFAGNGVSRAAFVLRISHRCAQIKPLKAQRFVLFNDDLCQFATDFFALLCADKHIILPPSDKPAMLESLASDTDMTIGQCRIGGVEHFSANPVNSAPEPSEHLTGELKIAHQASLCFFTSGSSGEPKQIDKRWEQLLSEVNDLEALWGEQLNAATVFSTVSHQHIYGLLFKLLWPILNGRTIAAQTLAFPETLVHNLEALHAKPMALISSPAFLQRTCDEPLWQQYAMQFAQVFSSGGPLDSNTALSIATALSHGTALSNDLAKEQATGPVEVLGSTETGGIAWRIQPALWQPFASVEVKTAEDNRLLLRSPYVSGSDWYHSEDAIALNHQGQFELLGRLDRIVKIEQKRLSLDELEKHLASHPFVSQCRAVVLQGKRQTLGCVCVLSEQGAQSLNISDKRQVNLALREHLAQYFDIVLLPRKWRYLAALPVNPQGKIQANTLIELFQS